MENPTHKKEPVWLVKINAYFSNSLRWGETNKLFSLKIRAVAKWWLDLVRNVVVVGLLQYFARKSDKLVVKIFAEVSSLALIAYVVSYLQWWSFHPFFFLKNRRAEFLASMVVGVGLALALLFSISGGIAVAIDEISRMQSR